MIYNNFIQLLFLSFTIFIVSGSYIVYLSDSYYISILFKPLLYYGKVLEPNSHIITRKYEVPKRWFTHFYIIAVSATTIAFIFTIYKYFYDGEIPEVIYVIFDLLFGSSRISVVSAESTVIAIILMKLHCWKRLYESYYISVYSDAKMNFIHYILGFIHYIGTICCIIGESNGFVRGTSDNFNLHKLNFIHYLCSIIFLLASYEQMNTNFILANLRKDHNGKVITKSYKIPYGRLFKYISAPLQFNEIIVYLMLKIILWNSSSFTYIFMFVFVNQIDAALSTHRWSRKTFINYPKQRKILIPFLL